MSKEIMTIDDVSKYLSLKTGTIYKFLEKGVLPGFKVGATWRFRKSTIDAWIAEQEKKAGTKKQVGAA